MRLSFIILHARSSFLGLDGTGLELQFLVDILLGMYFLDCYTLCFDSDLHLFACCISVGQMSER